MCAVTNLSQGWKAVWNNQYNEWFYVNIHTKASQWVPLGSIPKKLEALPDDRVRVHVWWITRVSNHLRGFILRL